MDLIAGANRSVNDVGDQLGRDRCGDNSNVEAAGSQDASD
jgi:hypothetical protein